MNIIDTGRTKNPIVVSEKLGELLLKRHHVKDGGRYLREDEVDKYLVPQLQEKPKSKAALVDPDTLFNDEPEKIEQKESGTLEASEAVTVTNTITEHWEQCDNITAAGRKLAIANEVDPSTVTATGKDATITTADIKNAIK